MENGYNIQWNPFHPNPWITRHSYIKDTYNRQWNFSNLKPWITRYSYNIKDTWKCHNVCSINCTKLPWNEDTLVSPSVSGIEMFHSTVHIINVDDVWPGKAWTIFIVLLYSFIKYIHIVVSTVLIFSAIWNGLVREHFPFVSRNAPFTKTGDSRTLE